MACSSPAGWCRNCWPICSSPAFRERFEAKGRFAAAMARVPTMAVVHPQAGLLGAAAFALQDVGNAQPLIAAG